MSEADHTAVHHPIESFADFAVRERERLTKLREFAVIELTAAQEKIAEIDREFAAIEAYEAAKTGKTANTPRQQRARHGSRREEVLNHIRNSDGLTRGDLLERMGLRGNKTGEMSVSNALTALKKTGHVHHDGRAYRALSVREDLRQAAE